MILRGIFLKAIGKIILCNLLEILLWGMHLREMCYDKTKSEADLWSGKNSKLGSWDLEHHRDDCHTGIQTMLKATKTYLKVSHFFIILDDFSNSNKCCVWNSRNRGVRGTRSKNPKNLPALKDHLCAKFHYNLSSVRISIENTKTHKRHYCPLFSR